MNTERDNRKVGTPILPKSRFDLVFRIDLKTQNVI